MPASCLMGCDCIKSTQYYIEFELCRLAMQSRCDTASAKDILNKNYDRFLFRRKVMPE
jgi:hypothetical protein